jgi:flavodoxin
MEKAFIIYFSQCATTAKVATEKSNGLKDRGYDTDLFSITGVSPPNVAEHDLIDIGSPVYVYRPAFNTTADVNDLPDLTPIFH